MFCFFLVWAVGACLQVKRNKYNNPYYYAFISLRANGNHLLDDYYIFVLWAVVEQTTTIHCILLQSNFPLLFMLASRGWLFVSRQIDAFSFHYNRFNFLYLIIIKSMSSRFMFLFFIYYYYYCYYYYGITIAYYDVRYKVMLKKTTRTTMGNHHHHNTAAA